METLEWLYDFHVKDNKTFFLGDHFQDEFSVTQNIIKIYFRLSDQKKFLWGRRVLASVT